MNPTEAGNEDLSSLLDGDFVQDWSLELQLDGALQSESLTTPIDFSSHSSPPFGVLTPMDASSFFLESSSSTKDCFSRTPVLAPYPEVTTGVDSLTSPFLTDPLLESVPEADPLTEDRRILSIHRDRSFVMEPENSLQNSPVFTDYSNCFIGSSPVPDSMDSNLQLLRSRANESDSNSSQESNFQISETTLNSQDPANVVSKSMVLQNQPNRSSTVLSRVLGTRTLSPSLLDSNHEESTTNRIQNPRVQKGTNSNEGIILMDPLSFQSTPQMKLPSLPKISAPVNSSPWAHAPPNGASLGRCFENQPQTSIRLNPLYTGYGLFQSLQSTSDGSCVSTITSGESSISGKTFEEKSNSNKPTTTTISKLTPEERHLKILRYKQKRRNRRFNRGVTYHCRKTLADSRPRVRGRFAKNDDIDAIPPQKTISKSTVNR